MCLCSWEIWLSRNGASLLGFGCETHKRISEVKSNGLKDKPWFEGGKISYSYTLDVKRGLRKKNCVIFAFPSSTSAIHRTLFSRNPLKSQFLLPQTKNAAFSLTQAISSSQLYLYLSHWSIIAGFQACIPRRRFSLSRLGVYLHEPSWNEFLAIEPGTSIPPFLFFYQLVETSMPSVLRWSDLG